MPRSIFRSRFPTASRWHFSSKELDSRNDDNLNRRSCFYPSYIIDFMKTRYRSSDYFGQQWVRVLFEPLPAGDSSASFSPGNSFDLARIEFSQSAIYFSVPSCFRVLVHVLIKTVEKGAGKRSPRLWWKLESLFQQVIWVLLHNANTTLLRRLVSI